MAIDVRAPAVPPAPATIAAGTPSLLPLAGSPVVTVAVSVPALLRDCADDQTRFTVEAATLQGAIDAMLAAHPLLRLHLFDEGGRQRKHVLLFYNDENVARLERRDRPLQPGDRLAVLQNVSGG